MSDKVAGATESQWRNLEAQTSKSKVQWIKLATAKGLAKHGELVAWLKGEYGIGHGYANLIALSAREAAAGGVEASDLVAAQYSGAKEVLKPAYDQLIKAVRSFGEDVEVSPKKGYVSLRRSKQFGLIQPSSAERLDVGLILKGVAPTARLEASGSFNAMVSHRVRLPRGAVIDAELKRWLKQAYDAA